MRQGKEAFNPPFEYSEPLYLLPRSVDNAIQYSLDRFTKEAESKGKTVDSQSKYPDAPIWIIREERIQKEGIRTDRVQIMALKTGEGDFLYFIPTPEIKTEEGSYVSIVKNPSQKDIYENRRRLSVRALDLLDEDVRNDLVFRQLLDCFKASRKLPLERVSKYASL